MQVKEFFKNAHFIKFAHFSLVYTESSFRVKMIEADSKKTKQQIGQKYVLAQFEELKE